MIISFITKNGLTSTTLPAKIRGQFFVADQTASDITAIIEGIDDEWILKPGRKTTLVGGDGNPIKSVAIHPSSIFTLKNKSGDSAKLLVETITENRQIFRKYLVANDMVLRIGRSSDNDIVYTNKFASAVHATLNYKCGGWSITDNNSTNGTFVNGKRINSAELHIGDVVFIMGLSLIIGKSFIAFNNPDDQVLLNANKLIEYLPQPVEKPDDDYEYELQQEEFFYRSPRFKRDIEPAKIKIDSPPQNAIGDEMPLMLVIGPSMTMGMASLSTAIFAINNAMSTGDISSALPSIVMSCSMLLGTVMWPILTKKYEKKRKYKKEALRQKKYREYLNSIYVQIDEECKKQEEILRENFCCINECENRILKESRNLWERAMGQNDFLRFRVGTGEIPMEGELVYSERKFTLDDDNLQEELYTLCETPKTLHNIPITYSLFEDHISGIIGDKKQTRDFAKGMIFQLASMYSYDEVKFVFIFDENEEKCFDFVKWLPHVWDNDKRFRFIGTNNNEVKEVSSYIEREIEVRRSLREEELQEVSPYYIIFSFSRQLSLRADMLKQIYAKKENMNISVITFYDELKNLPKECSMVVQLDGDSGKLFDKNDISGKTLPFRQDIFITKPADELSTKLANIPLDTLANGFKLPQMITFLEMFGVGKVEHLNVMNRWKENDPTKSLEAAVGVDTMGELFKLDLHEKFHGPHGLVAGMTGSGKSEFIITYILSLAVNYHPNEVAFILIDYKGGGMAKSFENLPHTAGIITNLDGAAIKRSLVSIQSELKRRQTVFAEASKNLGISNIDIYKYQKLYREKKVAEPLQHLFIISDEFAELKTQQPEFMTQLVSAARIGRSLGVHLILATQKPSGVVDDQIWSNSKFRVCLKVQERSDSMDMLKRPDAASLTDTGRFYLQVGYNELFEMGQSAWAGAPYYPSDRVQTEKDNSVVVVDRNGRQIRQAKLDRKREKFANAKKQLDAITEYLQSIAKDEGIKVRQLWLDPIPGVIIMDELIEKYTVPPRKKRELCPVIGLYDDPARQRQDTLTLPLTAEGNAIVYGSAGMGKTSFINAMLYSLINEHSADELNIYILDFASETLRAFANAPQVGDVILSNDGEKINNLFKMLLLEAKKRKKLLADYGGDIGEYIAATGKSMPSIVTVINNFSAFIELYEEQEQTVAFLTREGTKYGIYFVLTALSSNAVRFRLLQNFKQLIALQLNDDTEYSSILGKTEGLFPSKCKGRGLVKLDELYEFQVASLTTDSNPYSFIRKHCTKLAEEWNGERAKKIPILPDVVDDVFLREYISWEKSLCVPIGVEKHSLNVHYYPFDSSYVTLALSANDEYENFALDLAKLMQNELKLDVMVFDAGNCFAGKDGAPAALTSAKDCEAGINELFETVLYRNNSYKTALENGETPEAYPQKTIVIVSLSKLKNAVSDEANQKLALVLEKGEIAYNCTFVVAEQIKRIAESNFEAWYKKHITGSDGIWIGNGISEQYQLKPGKITEELSEELEAGFGYSLQKGKCVRLKLLNLKGETADEQ